MTDPIEEQSQSPGLASNPDDASVWRDEESAHSEMQRSGTGPDVVLANTWSGGATSTESNEVIEARAERQHARVMQSRVLNGIAGLLVFVLVAVIGSQAAHWVTEAFASRIADLMLPALLTTGGTAVGFYFRRGDDK